MEESENSLSLMDFEFFCVKEKFHFFCFPPTPKDSSPEATIAVRRVRFFPFMGLAFFLVPPVIDSVASTRPPAEKPLGWNGRRSAGNTLCMEISNLQVFSVTHGWGSVCSVYRGWSDWPHWIS